MGQPDNQIPRNLPEYGTAVTHGLVQTDSQEPAKLGPVGRLIGVLFSPGETFADINRKPTWLVPMILAMIVTIGSFLAFNWRVKPDWPKIIRAQMIQRAEDNNQPKPSEDQLEQGVEVGMKITKGIAYASALFAPVTYLALSGIFALSLIFVQANTTFKKILSVVAWSGCGIWLVSIVVTTAVLMAKDAESLAEIDMSNPSAMTATNLSAFLPSDSSGALKALASSLDVFSIWWIILLIIGLAAIGGSKKITKSTTAKIVLALWILFVLGKVGIRATGVFGR